MQLQTARSNPHYARVGLHTYKITVIRNRELFSSDDNTIQEALQGTTLIVHFITEVLRTDALQELTAEGVAYAEQFGARYVWTYCARRANVNPTDKEVQSFVRAALSRSDTRQKLFTDERTYDYLGYGMTLTHDELRASPLRGIPGKVPGDSTLSIELSIPNRDERASLGILRLNDTFTDNVPGTRYPLDALRLNALGIQGSFVEWAKRHWWVLLLVHTPFKDKNVDNDARALVHPLWPTSGVNGFIQVSPPSELYEVIELTCEGSRTLVYRYNRSLSEKRRLHVDTIDDQSRERDKVLGRLEERSHLADAIRFILGTDATVGGSGQRFNEFVTMAFVRWVDVEVWLQGAFSKEYHDIVDQAPWVHDPHYEARHREHRRTSPEIQQYPRDFHWWLNHLSKTHDLIFVKTSAIKFRALTAIGFMQERTK